MSGSLRMGPEVVPLQRQLHRTTDKQRQQQQSCNMQASLAVVQAIAISKIDFDSGVVVLLEICTLALCLTFCVLVLQSNK